MDNVRHITLFNEFILDGNWDAITTAVNNKRNINCISLNRSMKYKLRNLSIDVGYVSLKTDTDAFLISNPAFPIRFYLSENPIIENIITGSLTYDQAITFNGIVSPSKYDLIQSDKLDSSNQSATIPPYSYSNFLEIFEKLNNTPYYNYTRLKTFTLAEFNFFNLFQSSTSRTIGGTFDYRSNLGFNDVNSFDFESNTYSNLSISVFPKIWFIPLASFNLYLNYTINFDLIEESPR